MIESMVEKERKTNQRIRQEVTKTDELAPQLQETVIRAKAMERKRAGKKTVGHVDPGPHGQVRLTKSRDLAGAKIGMSGRTYEKATYVLDFEKLMNYCFLLDMAVQGKTRECTLSGKKSSNPGATRRQGRAKRASEIVGAKIGMSGRAYEKATYVLDFENDEQLKAELAAAQARLREVVQ